MYTFLKRVLFLGIILGVICFLTPQASFAEGTSDSFNITANLTYNVLPNLETKVSQNIVIINKKEFVYSPAYSVTLHIKNIHDISVKGKDGSIPYTVADTTGGSKTITIEFPDRVLGIGSQNPFTLSYVSSDFAQRTGDITRITIPSLSNPDAFSNYSATVTVPAQFGNPTLIKPSTPYAQNANSFTFSKDNLHGSAIEIYFGSTQLYKFNLKYTLENKNLFPIKTEIALPPNTSYQNVLLEKIVPLPDSTYLDADGNVMATYTLQPKTNKRIDAEVLINVSNIPSKEALVDQQKKLYLKPQKYWETENPGIKKIASSLKTPEEIYDYTVKTLEYNKDKTADQNTRLGALLALSKPYFAVCLEFTDLFVALSRAAGIPARAVEGYAYTDDETDKPVSLFKDVLHAWPEYYDSTRNTWVMVDPTWEDTTGGVDYFHALDFDHVAFTINGKDSAYPIPAGGYKINPDTQDISVSFPPMSEYIKETNVSVSGSFSSFVHGATIPGTLTLKNKGNYEVSDYQVRVLLDGKNSLDAILPSVPPLGEGLLPISIPLPSRNFLASLTNITHTVTIQSTEGKILATYTVRVFPFSELILIGGAAGVTGIIILIIAIKTRSLPVQRRK